ncbi:MAG: glycosyltransferase family 2 protein [Flavobacteriaceae bacterium]|nr:glycosyltransferase family 2 protein [Bacteroidia bacterium]NNK83917.1 glycosyltransferase family 2 protein [Flavobacteriaceae bacterium]
MTTTLNTEAKKIEILISTMNRTSMDFLYKMTEQLEFTSLEYLIVNQTSKDKLLVSKDNNVRVINSFEKGLAKSRNVAIAHAKGDICLLADDDVKYFSKLNEKISQAFISKKEADIITFQMVDEHGNLFRDYPDILKHNKKTLYLVNSVGIAFKRKNLLDRKVLFNELFGLGSIFETADEYVFLRNALNKNLNMCFEPVSILEHAYKSSGKNEGFDKLIFARAALFYKYSGFLAYLRLFKHLYLVYKNKGIKFSQLYSKYKVGLKGIKEYKMYLRKGLEKR